MSRKCLAMNRALSPAAVALSLALSAWPAFAQTSRPQPASPPATKGDTSDLPPKGALALPPQGQTAGVPVGNFAGGAESDLAALIRNPGSSSDAELGHNLYVRLNCADCHGFNGKGGMGPDLTDSYWIFGGTPAEIFKSIFEGRPEGMPSWGKALPAKDIWQLVSFIQTLGGAHEPARYRAAQQGDKPGDLGAPELNFEQRLDGSPPYPDGMFAGMGKNEGGQSGSPAKKH